MPKRQGFGQIKPGARSREPPEPGLLQGSLEGKGAGFKESQELPADVSGSSGALHAACRIRLRTM